MKIGCSSKRIACIEEKHRSIVLAHVILEEVVHANSDHDYLRPGSLPEQSLQCIEPVVIAGRFEKNGINAHSGGSERVQAIQFNAVQEQRIAYHQDAWRFSWTARAHGEGFVVLLGNSRIRSGTMFQHIDR